MADDKRFCPIIYVRGYAMSRSEIDDTTADPFCGFNLGSTVARAVPNAQKPARKFIFESPVVRLRSDYEYHDVYNNGVDILDPDWNGAIARRSIIIFRYYDSASSLLGESKTPEIEDFALSLSELVLKVRELVCDNPDNQLARDAFKCHLVAHSMGGLVCRAFLQNSQLGSADARRCIDKFFTYATPHNGIDLAGINAPEWLGVNDINNFNRERMSRYLELGARYAATQRVDWLPESKFPSERVFCLVGTNRADYQAAAGVSRTFAGHGSDGLVKVANASVWGVDDNGKTSKPSATAYVYRSHSGYFGIVNSEESYQNLVRFLFGDVRVDVWLDIATMRVPEELMAADAQGKLDALYQFEVLASPRGKRWYLTRRVAEEDSVACRSHADLKSADPAARQIYLSTIFLSNLFRINPQSDVLAYSMTLGVRVPDYEVDRKFWPDRHYEGQYLFRDSIVLELKPPQLSGDQWTVQYDWQSTNVGQASTSVKPDPKQSGQWEVSVPVITSDATPPISPGIEGKLRFVVSAWNS
jgi:hypothetical protein